MKTYPLHSISLEQAKQLQFKVIDAVTRNFQGEEVLSLGDLGVVKGLNKPRCTVKVEKVFADTFDAPAALLVRGSGTGAIRWALTACLKPGDAILVHTSPIYTTTQVTIDAMGLKPIRADFNDLEQLKAVCAQHKDEIRGALVQLTRQKPEDRYDYKAVIAAIKAALPGITVVTDDNYAALKVDAIGCQAGADLSTFSCFKILGPEGVGAVIGSKELIDRIYKMQYSGGSQVQGHEAMEALRGLIYAPVALAIQSEVNEELVRRLNAGEVPHVRQAFLANAQSKVLLVEFDQEIAEKILDAAPKKFSAAPHQWRRGANMSCPRLIYRVSGTFRAQDPTIEHRMIRINPMRSGPDTIIRILPGTWSRSRKTEPLKNERKERCVCVLKTVMERNQPLVRLGIEWRRMAHPAGHLSAGLRHDPGKCPQHQTGRRHKRRAELFHAQADRTQPLIARALTDMDSGRCVRGLPRGADDGKSDPLGNVGHLVQIPRRP